MMMKDFFFFWESYSWPSFQGVLALNIIPMTIRLSLLSSSCTQWWPPQVLIILHIQSLLIRDDQEKAWSTFKIIIDCPSWTMYMRQARRSADYSTMNFFLPLNRKHQAWVVLEIVDMAKKLVRICVQKFHSKYKLILPYHFLFICC